MEVRTPSVLVSGLAARTHAGKLSLRLSDHDTRRRATTSWFGARQDPDSQKVGDRGTRCRVIGRVVRRAEFDAALVREVRTRGVEVREGVALTGMRRHADRVELTTTAGTLSARCVVGADGVGSQVRRLLGLARGDLYAQAVEVDTPIVPADEPMDLLSFDLTDSGYAGYAWAFPTLVDGELKMCRGVYRLVRGAPEAHAQPEGPTPRALDVNSLLEQQLGALGIARSGLQFKRFAERGLCAHEPCARPRVLLVGEAAGVDPVLGEGIAQAILYGKMAGPYLARAYRKASGRGEVLHDAYRFLDYTQTLSRSRVGIDLALRARALPWLYGKRRGGFERWLTRSRHLAFAGMYYFAGEHVPRWCLARALADLALATRRGPPFRDAALDDARP
ncbi:MAG: NAD(P)/FAD-dependent oxidoreductase [Myxococcales bacterium]|nr:NAD(P)/FAD-dependent oxidoreductase [Myxococcales bacterium]